MLPRFLPQSILLFALFAAAGASWAKADCGARAIVLKGGTHGALVEILVTNHHRQVSAELARTGIPMPAKRPCLTCGEPSPLLPVPPAPSWTPPSQLDGLALANTALELPFATSSSSFQSSDLYQAPSAVPPTPPPIA